jgi:hypothetical protein
VQLNNWKRADIAMSKLVVDLGNFRIGDQDHARAAYHAMITEEGGDLVNLAADIIENGLSPSELPIICKDPENNQQYVVLEGNRRLTAIRLMEKPALADGTTVHPDFVRLSKEYLKAPIKAVHCVELPDKATALLWIERRHRDLGGRGLSKWGAPATSRADAFKGTVRPSKAVMDFLKAKGELSSQLESRLSKQTTNLDRVFQMPYFESALGVRIGKDGTIQFGSGDEPKGIKLLNKIVKAMSATDFTVNNIRHVADRQNFIDSFARAAVVGALEQPGSKYGAVAAKKAPAKTLSRVAASDERSTLAIKGAAARLNIDDSRLSELYVETLKIQPDALPNTSAVLTRVFIELSTDHFLQVSRVPIDIKHLQKGKRSWSDQGISLVEKIKTVLSQLDPTGKAPEFKNVRKGLSDDGAIHSINALHEFVHQITADPQPKEIKRIWARWHPYLHALFTKLS